MPLRRSKVLLKKKKFNDNLWTNKIIIFSGKGGVGKTCISTGVALHLSQVVDKRILLISTDPAHNIADVLHVRTKKNQFTFKGKLDVKEIDADEESKRYIKQVSNTMKEYVHPEQYSEVEKYLQLARLSPGLQEAAMLDALSTYVLDNSGEYDQIIIDTAPTGHALRLMTLPSIMTEWMQILLKKKKKTEKLKEQWGSNTHGITKAREVIENRIHKYQKLMDLLIDPKQCSFNFIMNAEHISYQESLRAIKTLNQFKIKISGLYINKVLNTQQLLKANEPKEREQKRIIQQAHKHFHKVPIIKFPQIENPLHGDLELLKLIKSLYV